MAGEKRNRRNREWQAQDKYGVSGVPCRYGRRQSNVVHFTSSERRRESMSVFAERCGGKSAERMRAHLCVVGARLARGRAGLPVRPGPLVVVGGVCG